MHIAYATTDSATDLRVWSGANRNILDAIRAQGVDAKVIQNLATHRSWRHKLKERYYRHLAGKSFACERDPEIVSAWAAQVETLLKKAGPVDCVVSPGTLAVAALSPEIPTAFWTDATFHVYHSTYSSGRPICQESVQAGDVWERRALKNAVLACYTSEWAAADAIQYYGANPQKVHVVPFGANCPPAYPSRNAAENVVGSRSREQCELLFIGVDWERKGGPLLLEIADSLKRSGVPIRLTIAGCNPFNGRPAPSHVECLGFLSRDQPHQQQKLNAAFQRAHFFVMPSLAEAYGLVYAEASAYAVPSLARNVGGVGSVVHHNKNGWLLAPDADAAAYSDLIAQRWNDRESYVQAALGAYDEWETRLNWRVAGANFVTLLEKTLRSH